MTVYYQIEKNPYGLVFSNIRQRTRFETASLNYLCQDTVKS
jgi:Na+/serine symporter